MKLLTLLVIFNLVFTIRISAAAKKGKQACRGEDGKRYRIGTGYTKGCSRYTCRKIGKKVKMKRDSVCCIYQGIEYMDGHIIEEIQIGQCSKRTVKCGKNFLNITFISVSQLRC